MPIAMMIQLAVQAASGAIGLLQQLGYLKPAESQQIMTLLMNGHIPDTARETQTEEGV